MELDLDASDIIAASQAQVGMKIQTALLRKVMSTVKLQQEQQVQLIEQAAQAAVPAGDAGVGGLIDAWA